MFVYQVFISSFKMFTYGSLRCMQCSILNGGKAMVMNGDACHHHHHHPSTPPIHPFATRNDNLHVLRAPEATKRTYRGIFYDFGAQPRPAIFLHAVCFSQPGGMVRSVRSKRSRKGRLYMWSPSRLRPRPRGCAGTISHVSISLSNQIISEWGTSSVRHRRQRVYLLNLGSFWKRRAPSRITPSRQARLLTIASIFTSF